METRRRSCIAVQTGLAAEYEQRRRMLNASGEQLRQENSHSVAKLIAELGPSYRLRHAPTPMLRSRPVLSKGPYNITKASKTRAAGGWPLLQNAMHFASDLSHNVSTQVSDMTKNVSASVSAQVSDLGHRVSELGHSVSETGQATAASVYHKATDLGNRAINAAGDYLNHYMTAAQRTYLRGQEEIERVRRITSEEEHWAMLNAFASARCMRGYLQGKDRYEPLSARNVDAYWAKLLEQCEMRRRCSYPMPAQRNAKKIVGLLANTRHNPHSDLCIPYVRIQQWHDNQAFIPASLAARQTIPLQNLEHTAIPNIPTDLPEIPLEHRAHIPPAPPMPSRAVPKARSGLRLHRNVPARTLGGSGVKFSMPALDFSALSGAEKVVVFYPVIAEPTAEVKVERMDAQGNIARAAM